MTEPLYIPPLAVAPADAYQRGLADGRAALFTELRTWITTLPDPPTEDEVIAAQAKRIRDLVSENVKLTRVLRQLVEHVDPDSAPGAELALAYAEATTLLYQIDNREEDFGRELRRAQTLATATIITNARNKENDDA